MTTIKKCGFLALAAFAMGLIFAAFGATTNTMRRRGGSSGPLAGEADTSIGRLMIADLLLIKDEGIQKLVAFDNSRALQDADTSAFICFICLVSNPGCLDCLDLAIDALLEKALEESNTISCTDFRTGVCPSIATDCPCGDLECRQATEDYYEGILATLQPEDAPCQTLDCGLTAATAAPTPVPDPVPPTLGILSITFTVVQNFVAFIQSLVFGDSSNTN